ncbi:HAD-IA family hydrolase [Kitasatospora saccharophila]|uniref:HAD-IA family hydrolase n=1 Tax=Kitasatospora saccharophila TaxID=407973 RepID=A0ABN2WCA4_9ACTN
MAQPHGDGTRQDGDGTDRPPPRGLILDFAGVLTRGTGTSHRAWCEREGLAPDAWWRTLTGDPAVRALYADLEVGRIGQAEWNRRVAPALGLADHVDLMGRAWSTVRPAVRMIALARAARAAGHTVALLSNSFGTDPYDPYAALGLWELFDVAVISERVGLAKPDPAIYRLVLEAMGLPGRACVFVDDQPANLPPARALGVETVLADGEDATVERVAALLGLPPVPAG